jgi:hypothetical protein
MNSTLPTMTTSRKLVVEHGLSEEVKAQHKAYWQLKLEKNRRYGEEVKAVHRPTGKPCTILFAEINRCMCNFGDAPNPFTWVDVTELEFQS